MNGTFVFAGAAFKKVIAERVKGVATGAIGVNEFGWEARVSELAAASKAVDIVWEAEVRVLSGH